MTVNSDGGGGAGDGAADDGNGGAGTGADGAGSGDDKNAKPYVPMDLDHVHERVMQEHGEEFSKPEPEAGADDGAGDGSGDDGAGAAADDDKDKGGAAGDADADAAAAAAEAEKDKTPPVVTPPVEAVKIDPPVAPESDSDVTKPGKYKSEFTDQDGNKFYVTDVSQLPEDFEPASQRAYGLGLQTLFQKQGEYKTDQSTYEADKAKYTTHEAVTKLQSSWNADIETLGKDGIKLDDGRTLALPKEKDKRELAIKGTYAFMDAEHKRGNTIQSFATAYEIYENRVAAAAAQQAAAAKKVEDAKKTSDKGAKVMGGTATAVAGNKPLIRAGLPPGVGLDAVHAKAQREISGGNR